jgi:6-pyruvoyltetrahydropterin/6-carboxytetrahydropterin synthase
MAGPFRYSVTIEGRFEAAHNLRTYRGAEEPLHGHSWRVCAELATDELDEDDIAVDFVAATDTLNELCGHLDYTYINEVPPFDETNPTAENIARWFFTRMEQKLESSGAQVAAVEVHEGPKGFATVRRRDSP